MKMRNLFLYLSIISITIACGNDDKNPADEFAVDPETRDRYAEVEKVVWSEQDKPSILGDDFEYEFEKLPTEGEAATIPWAGSYWPTYQDNINVLWDGEDSISPAKKYENAFGGENIEEMVSKNNGIDSVTWAKECKEDSECDKDLGEKCAKRRGKEEGRCIQTWFGICHAWAPAAVYEKEPVNPVTHNGVEFKVNDIKALVTLGYDKGVDVKFLSLRCDKNGSKDDEKGVVFDEYGRPAEENAECRDTNPGTFHIVTANLLGVQKKSFLEDKTYDYEVWNQPVRSYKITFSEEVDAKRANELVGVTPREAFTENKTGQVKQKEMVQVFSFDVVPGRKFNVKMNGTNDADLYVRFDGEPSKMEYDCRPYINGSEESCTLVPSSKAKKVFVAVEGYSRKTSDFDITYEIPGIDINKYLFNDQAAKFMHVKMTFEYISESNTTTDGNLADRIDWYTNRDYYEYVLEIDSENKIMGGEWIGRSKKNHPDFLWMPYNKRDVPVAGGVMEWNKIKMLLDISTGDREAADTAVEEAPADDSATGSLKTDDLIISEYVEGSSNHKAVEIYNGTGVDVDLSEYNFKINVNGGWWRRNVQLGGTLKAGKTFVVCHRKSDAEIQAACDLASYSMSFNGDDGVLLRKGDVIVDSVGNKKDPGVAWLGSESGATKDHTIRRKCSVETGDKEFEDDFDLNVEWDVFPKNDFSGLGKHDC